MARKMLTLYEECLCKTAVLLQDSYWDLDLPLSKNPFASLPSEIIDTLTVYLTRISSSEKLHSNLRLLVRSGQVRNFTLDDDDNSIMLLLPPGLRTEYTHNDRDCDLDVEEFKKVLTDLSFSCHNLVSLKIKHFSCSRPSVEADISQLLSAATNIRYIESCAHVNMQSLCNCVKLEKLVLIDQSHDIEHVTDFLKHDGKFQIHASLKHFNVGATLCDVLSYSDIAIILKYCPELISINHDISKGLQYLHAKEFHNGTLSHKYKLRKFLLGCPKTDDVEGIHENCKFSAQVGALIASSTCPQLEELHLTLEDRESSISAFSDCQKLRKLSIRCCRFIANFYIDYEDYNLELRSFLGKPNIGRNLKYLEINTFTNVDVLSIDTFCPNLEALRVMHLYLSHFECPTVAFQKLKVLEIYHLEEGNMFSALVGVISKPTNLEELNIYNLITDQMFDEIFKKNNLSKLKKLYISTGSLSLRMWRELACKLTALERVEVFESVFSTHTFQEVADVFHDICPKVEVVRDCYKLPY